MGGGVQEGSSRQKNTLGLEVGGWSTEDLPWGGRREWVKHVALRLGGLSPQGGAFHMVSLVSEYK